MIATTEIQEAMALALSNPEAVLAEERRISTRELALSHTVNFAKITGANVMHPETGIYPWLPYVIGAADYLDRPIRNIAVPIKPIFIARLHLKTTLAGEAFARKVLANPEKRSAIFSWDSKKAEENLTQIAYDFKSKALQEAFPDRLYPDDSKSRFFYKGDSIMLKREGNYKEESVMALGATSDFTGKHFNNVIWIDDVVTEGNYRNPAIQQQVWEKIQHIIMFLAEPGCEIWISGTRYAFHDAYSNLLDKKSPFLRQIVPGYPNMGCIEEDAQGQRKAIFWWKYCVTPEEKEVVKEWRGEKHHLIRRSLDEMKEAMDPILWYSQMENSPQIGGQATFAEKDFGNIVPCEGIELSSWLDAHGAMIDPKNPDRGSLIVVIPGDPAYSTKTHSDFSVLLTVAQDVWDHWYVMDARVTRDGWNGLEHYLEQAYLWKNLYNAKEFAIEYHAKLALRAVDKIVSRNLGVTARWNTLDENSGGRNGIRKEERIAIALEDLLRNGRLWFCIPQGAGPTHPVEKFRQSIIREAIQFPNAKHDDCLDCLANCRQSFKIRIGDTNKTVDFFPGRQQLPIQIRRFMRVS